MVAVTTVPVFWGMATVWWENLALFFCARQFGSALRCLWRSVCPVKMHTASQAKAVCGVRLQYGNFHETGETFAYALWTPDQRDAGRYFLAAVPDDCG